MISIPVLIQASLAIVAPMMPVTTPITMNTSMEISIIHTHFTLRARLGRDVSGNALSMNFQSLGDRVLVLCHDHDGKTICMSEKIATTATR